MTEYELKRRAIRAFQNYWVPKNVKRRYQRDWLRSIQTLGDKWKLAKPIERLENPQ